MKDEGLYRYSANVTSVYDADTCTVDIDLGLGIWMRKQKLRFFGINAPEMRGPERPKGILARDFCRQLIDKKRIIIQTHLMMVKVNTVDYWPFYGLSIQKMNG